MPRTKYPLASLQDNEVTKALSALPDSVLQQIQFSFPLFSHSSNLIVHKKDEDGFPVVTEAGEGTYDLAKLHKECWSKFERNPQISSHVRDVMGRMAGWGFGCFSEWDDIQEVIDSITDDPRNALYDNFAKYVARAEIEGELFLMFTLHDDGFVEVDFIQPEMLIGGDKGSGIIFHPQKQLFPLFYNVTFTSMNGGTKSEEMLIPSINIAYFPELEEAVKTHTLYTEEKLSKSKNTGKNYDPIGGYYRFITRWDKTMLTQRNVSYIRTTIEWLNYYEELKKYEIDHKKSSGAYLWVITMEDVRAFRSWLSLTDEERKSTGILQPKEPGGTLVLPPGMKLDTQNPKLPSISDQDTDLLNMVASGLNKPQDMVMGDYNSTYASVKAAQGPQNDRINDDLAYFKNFIIYNFWRPVFFLTSIVSKFKLNRKVQEVIGFEDKKPITKVVTKPAYKLVDVAFPISKLEDVEAMAKAMLGSKHGSLVDQLGIPLDEVAKRLGFYNYYALRRKRAVEEEYFPELKALEDQEAKQENQIKGKVEPVTKKKPAEKPKK